MAIDLLYVPLFTIEEVILDKDTGLPLAAGVVSFFRDAQRATPKAVFQIAGSSPNYTFTNIGTELTLGLSGTFVDGSGDPFVPYAYPYDANGNVDLYYVTVVSEGDVDQFTREAVPYLAGTNIPANQRSSTENELSNPQFVEILFPTTGSTIINVSGSNTVTPIAPNWDIVSSGIGTLTLERLEPIASSVPTNPAYTLSIAASSGLGASITLRQRLTNTPSIMRGGFASGSITAAVLSGGGSNISMIYAPSTGSSDNVTIIPSTSINTDGAYHTIANNAAIPQFVNTAASSGYIDINISIPTSRTIAISSIQLVGTEVSLDIPFDEQTVARQKDHLFHYYEDALIQKPIPSHLVGWDFPLNPAQFLGHAIGVQAIGANKSFYAWDQTILFQSADSAFTVGQQTDGSLNIAPAVSTQIGIIQYLDATKATQILNQPISVNVCAYCDTTHQVKITISLWYTTDGSLPDIKSGTNNSLVATLDANGKPDTFNGNWTEVTRTTSREAVMILNPQTSPMTSQSFNYWDLADNSLADTATFFAIVVATESIPFPGSSIYVRSISLCSGDIATLPAPQTVDDVLLECEYYYEKSYSSAVVPGTVSALNTFLSEQTFHDAAGAPHTIALVGRNIYLPFHTIKPNATPTITVYSPSTGTADRVHGFCRSGASAVSNGDIVFSTNWTSAFDGDKAHAWTPANTSDLTTPANVVIDFPEAYILFHYTIDARLGV